MMMMMRMMRMMIRRTANSKKETSTCDRDVAVAMAVLLLLAVVPASSQTATDKVYRVSVRKVLRYRCRCLLFRKLEVDVAHARCWAISYT